MHINSTLNQLKAALPKGQLPSSYGVYYKNTLVALCHALEDHILQQRYADSANKPLVLVTFQQGKWYLQEAERYLEIAKCSREVAIAAVPDSGFATHPTSKLSNVNLVNIPKCAPLVNEWNLIILAPDYAGAVLCYELPPEEYGVYGVPELDTERKFYGLWTFHRAVAQEAAGILIKGMGSYNSSLADRLGKLQEEIKPSTTPTDLSPVVSRIVTYLQSSQQQLVTVNRQHRELVELEGQAQRLNRNLAANKLQAFLRMAQKIDQEDKDNPVASLQVAALGETLGQILDLPTLKLRRLRLAGLLFRIGLAGANPEVFRHPPEELDEATFAFWRDRSLLGSELLKRMPELAPITAIVRHHLEWWNGSGKPDGLQGEAIEIEARILGLVAYFQSLTQPRGSRGALSLESALAKCQELCGTRFDPGLIESLTTVIRLTTMGLMTLPSQPSQLPHVWLEQEPKTKTEVA